MQSLSSQCSIDTPNNNTKGGILYPRIIQSKTEKVQFWATPAEKHQLQRLAELNHKTLSQYSLDAALTMTLDTAKMDFYTSIHSDLNYLKRTTYVSSKLELLIAAEQYGDQDFVVKFYKATMGEGEKLFKGD